MINIYGDSRNMVSIDLFEEHVKNVEKKKNTPFIQKIATTLILARDGLDFNNCVVNFDEIDKSILIKINKIDMEAGKEEIWTEFCK